MALSTRLQLVLQAMESSALDLTTVTAPHRLNYPPPAVNSGLLEFASGTTDNKFDTVWSDSRTLVATTDALDLRGGLLAAIGGAALAFVEVTGIIIHNKATAAASILKVGGGANPSFAGLFGATGDIIVVPAGGLFVWFAPLDGGGLATTAGTADILTIDSVAATISYDIIIIGRSS